MTPFVSIMSNPSKVSSKHQEGHESRSLGFNVKVLHADEIRIFPFVAVLKC